jgi:uncharacterized protein
MENLNPRLDERIVDDAKLFTDQEKDSLFNLIREVSLNIGPQIGIATVDYLSNESIEQYSLRMIDKMKLGRKSYMDGLLFAISKNDKLIRIDVGNGLRRIISDENAEWINRELIAPKFKQDLYFEGMLNGLNYAKKLIEDNKALVGKIE